MTIPYSDHCNDYLQIYLKSEGEEVIFSDDSFVIHSLETVGLAMNEESRQLLSQYGIILKGKELTARCTASDFHMRLDMFLQGIIRLYSEAVEE